MPVPDSQDPCPRHLSCLSPTVSTGARQFSCSALVKPVKPGRGKGKEDAPGSKARLAKYLQEDKLFLAGRTYDLAGIAKHFKTSVSAHCWPTLLTNKKGVAALALCPEPSKHGGLNSKMHTPPDGWSATVALEKYSEPASNAQKRAAGWTLPGGGKRGKP